MKYSLTAIVVAAGLLSSCAVGPNYTRPTVATPANFRAPEPLPAPQAESLADLKWFEIFNDEELQYLTRTALKQNYDLRDAVARVEQARANLGITRSNQFPQVSASGEIQFTRLSRDGSLPLPETFVPSQNRNWGQASLNLLSFEVDLWGRLRRSTEAARANLLNAEENRKAVVTTLVSDVATDYFNLLQLDYELEISKRTLDTRRESLRLVEERRGGGVSTLLDLRQAEQLVSSAAEEIPTLEQQIEQTENQISLLLGENPGNVIRGRKFMEQEVRLYRKKEDSALDLIILLALLSTSEKEMFFLEFRFNNQHSMKLRSVIRHALEFLLLLDKIESKRLQFIRTNPFITLLHCL